MKGIVSVLELLLTGIILVLAFLHFFPQYSIRTEWSSMLLDLSVRDTLNTIDRLNKTYDYATVSCSGSDFETFMNNVFSPQHSREPYIWWKEVSDIGDNEITCSVPYFSEAKKETIVDVIVDENNQFYVYSFTLGLGYPY